MSKGSEGPVPVLVMGLGAIGRALVRAALESAEVQLLGAVDPQYERRALGELVGRPALKHQVHGSLRGALNGQRGVVILQATHSRLPEVLGSIEEAIRAGCHVVSTCEELTFPWLKYPKEADRLDRAAADAGVVVLGMGVNPGFLMDRLVATVGQTVGRVTRVVVERHVDVRTRREGLIRRVGLGLTEDAFFDHLEADRIGLPGMVEAAALCGLGLGLDCDDFEEEHAPVIAQERLEGTPVVEAGQVAGMSQTVIASEDGVERVRLEVMMAAGIDAPGDVIQIDADTSVRLRIEGGLQGDLATAHMVVHAAPRVTAAEPGILTVLELPAGR
jgi:hypothetical protein